MTRAGKGGGQREGREKAERGQREDREGRGLGLLDLRLGLLREVAGLHLYRGRSGAGRETRGADAISPQAPSAGGIPAPGETPQQGARGAHVPEPRVPEPDGRIHRVGWGPGDQGLLGQLALAGDLHEARLERVDHGGLASRGRSRPARAVARARRARS